MSVTLRPSPANMGSKGLILLLWMVVCSTSALRRDRRTLSWLFPSEEQKKELPIYKVHHYTGIQLQPLVPGPVHPFGHGVPEISGAPPDVLEVPEESYDSGNEEETPSALGSLGTLVSLIPYSSGLLSGALGLSGGSLGGGAGGDSDLKKRIGLAAKKNALLTFKKKKFNFAAGIASSALNKVINKGHAAKNVIKGVFKGPAKYSPFNDGIYHYVPYGYPKHQGLISKIPFLGKLFGYGRSIDLPEVYLPYLPQLAHVPYPPNLPFINLPNKYELPYQTGSYIKIKVPKVGKYDIPSTSYGVPAVPVPVPEYSPPQPEVEEVVELSTPEPVVPVEVSPTIPPETLPYPSEAPETAPYPAEVPEKFPYPPEVPEKFPYPPEGQATFPYPPEVPEAPQFVPPPPPLPENPTEVFDRPPPTLGKPQGFPYPPEVPETPEYIPPPPALPEPPLELPSLQPYPPASTFQIQSYPYPPAGFPYSSGFYEASGSENHEVAVKPDEDNHPVYRHKEEEPERKDEESSEPINVVEAQIADHHEEPKTEEVEGDSKSAEIDVK